MTNSTWLVDVSPGSTRRKRVLMKPTAFSDSLTFSLSFLLLLFTSLNSFAQVKPSIQWQKAYGGSGADVLNKMIPVTGGGYLLIGSSTSSVGGEKSQNSHSSLSDFWIVRVDANGNKLWDKTYGSIWTEDATSAVQTADGGFVVVGSISKARETPQYAAGAAELGDVSEGDKAAGFDFDIWAIKIDASGNKLWDRRLGSATYIETAHSVLVQPNGDIIIGGVTDARAANGDVSQAISGLSQTTPNNAGYLDHWFVQLNSSGTKLSDKRIPRVGLALNPKTLIRSADGGYYVVGDNAYSLYLNISTGMARRLVNLRPTLFATKLDANFNQLWYKDYEGTSGSASRAGGATVAPNGDLMFAASSNSGVGGDKTSPTFGGADMYLLRINSGGDKIWDRTYGGASDENSYAIVKSPDGGYFLAGNSQSSPGGDKTDPGFGSTDYWILKLTEDGVVKWDKTVGGASAELAASLMPLSDGTLLVAGYSTSSIGGNKTEASRGGNDYWLVKLGCAYVAETIANDISPASQTACINGTALTIIGTDDDGQYPDIITYQWQKASSASGPWADIAIGTTKDYLPEPAAATTYYRRVAKWDCNHQDISNVSVVTITADAAPSLAMGGPYNTCSGTGVTMTGTSASGGTAPYTYSWDYPSFLNNPASANPIASVTATTVFSLTVTDGKGCRKVGQAIVNVPFLGAAGPDKTFCQGGSGVQIGAAPVAGLSGVTYSWSPSSGLSATNVAQPVASPSAPTTYTLTITYTNSSGTSCTVTDQVAIDVAVAPSSNFAGDDRILCSTETTTTTLGTAAPTGYTYTWSPGLYLESNNTATVTFNMGSVYPPAANPITYTLTATRNGCTFTDQTVVTVLRAYADRDGCGPRTIGTPDITPNINETYSWSKKAGSNGNSTLSSSTSPNPSVTAITNGGTDTYVLTVSLNGIAYCTDEVVVPPCGICTVDFLAEGGNCIKYNGKPLKLTADQGGQYGYTYAWSPATGLSGTNGPEVYLLDGVNRSYTVTKTKIGDPSNTCTVTKEVNNPAASYPVFSAPDKVACEGSTTTIGSTAVSGYTYSWTGPNGFTSSVSNPGITISKATTEQPYYVQVNDNNPGNSAGCFTLDTVHVGIETMGITGKDWTVCTNAIVQLGQADPSGGTWTYSWTPANASWQNGSNQNSPQPTVLVATNTAFTLNVTSPSGCSSTTTHNVTVNNNPTIANAPDISNACPGAVVKIGSEALPGVTYSWSPTTGLDNPNTAQPNAIVGASGSTTIYTVTATFPGTCNSIATDQVTVSAANTGFNLANISYCPSSGPVNIGANAPSTGVTAYSWSPATGLSSTTIANPTTNIQAATEYTLTVSYSTPAGCTASAKVLVTPSSTPNAGSDKNVCPGSSVVLGTPSNLTSATWTGSGIAYLNSTTGATVVFNGAGNAPAGTYTFTVTQTQNGCTNSDEVVVIVSGLTANPGAVSICQAGTGNIGVSPTAGYAYTWSPATGLSTTNSSTTSVTLSSPGTYFYTLTIHDGKGCSANAMYTVTVTASTAPSVTIPSTTACAGTPFTLSPTVTPSAGNYSYAWNPATGLSNPYIKNPVATINAASEYTLFVTDNTSGCSSSGSGIIQVDPLDGNYITVGPTSSTACRNTAVTLTAQTNPTYSYIYQWEKYNESTSVWESVTNGGLFSGATTSTLNISNNATLNGAQFRILVTTTSCGAQQASNVATLTVNQCLKSSLGDYVWYDTDRDGIQDTNESGVQGVNVNLYRNGVKVATTTTTSTGYYIFDNLDAYDSFGNLYKYQVEFTTIPTGYVFTTQGVDAGSNGAGTNTDSDVNPATGRSREVTLTYGAHLPDVDAGIHSSSPLPVELKSFTGKSDGCSVSLFWSVAQEASFSRYAVEYSTNGKDFRELVTVKAMGSNSDYSFKPEFFNNKPFYRLKMIDLDGTVAYSKILAFIINCQSPVSLYPNPGSDYVQIKFGGNLDKVTIFNANGIIVKSIDQPKSDQKINIGNLTEGIYFIKSTNSEGNSFSNKLIIKK